MNLQKQSKQEEESLIIAMVHHMKNPHFLFLHRQIKAT